MGRGKRKSGARAQAAPGVPKIVTLSDATTRTRFSPADVAKDLVAAGAIRDMRVSYNPDQVEYKRKEREFVKAASGKLHALMSEYASSDDGWRQLLQIYSHAPHYSITNILWARAQLAHKGVRADGLIFSKTAWKALGRRVKPEYLRQWKPGDDGKPTWDDLYIAGIMSPIFAHQKKGEKEKKAKTPSATPSLATAVAQSGGSVAGQLLSQPVDTQYKHSNDLIGFRVADVYHEDATEVIEGEAELPRPSWFEATGSDEDAAKLWKDIEYLADLHDVEIRTAPATRSGIAQASYDRATNTITLTESDHIADRASAALGALVDHFGPNTPAKDDNEAKARIVARESAKYAIASLYGLASDKQSFTFLADIAQDDKLLKKATDDTHQRVISILNILDPMLKRQALGKKENKTKYESRANKQKGQRRRSMLAD